METKIKWNEGDGYITATYEGSGNGSASISSDVNEGIDRVQSIVVATTQGSEPKSESVQVTQIGLREIFEPSDGMFVLADGGTYNVLKIGGEKIVNQLRLAILSSNARVIVNMPKIVNADTLDYPLSWDYAVNSNVTVQCFTTGDWSQFIIFNKGEKDSNYTKYWSDDFEGLRCEPAEDDMYIYEVILTDLRVEEPQIPTSPSLGVTIATSEGYFIPYAEWENQGTAVGVCVKTDSFAIILDLEIASKRWTQSTSSSVSGVPTFTSTNNISQYMDGQSYTDSMIARTSSTTYAAGYARSRKITINGTEYVGYVGSAGEWQAVMSYDDDIMAAFTKLGKSFSGSTYSRNIWTSCQYSNSNAWRFSFTSSGFGSFGNTSKSSSAYVKALYKYE